MAGHRFEIGECVAYLEKRFPNGVRRTELVVVGASPGPASRDTGCAQRTASPSASSRKASSARPRPPRRRSQRPRCEPSGAKRERQPVVGMSRGC